MYGVFLRDLGVMARIGVHAFEREKPQRLLVNVALALADAGAADAIEAVVDYDFLKREIEAIVTGGHVELQETLCRAILDRCWAQPGVIAAVVSTQKPDVYPDAAGVGCRMFRLREGADRAEVGLALGI